MQHVKTNEVSSFWHTKTNKIRDSKLYVISYSQMCQVRYVTVDCFLQHSTLTTRLWSTEMVTHMFIDNRNFILCSRSPNIAVNISRNSTLDSPYVYSLMKSYAYQPLRLAHKTAAMVHAQFYIASYCNVESQLPKSIYNVILT